MFDLEQFTADCRAALAADSSHKLVREVVARAVSDPTAVLKGIGEPKRAEVQKLYHAPDLTILNVIWGPMMTIMPHNHQMWAVIGIYSGREDNVFWRLPEGRGRVEAAGARALQQDDHQQFGQYMFQSHESSRDFLKNSTRELDLLVDLARRHPACLGARLTGGGFGGATVNLVAHLQAESFMKHMAEKYHEATGIRLEPLACQIVDGAG